MARYDAQPTLAESGLQILTQEHHLMNFLCLFISAGGLQDLFHSEEMPTQSSAWCLEMVGLPTAGLLLEEGSLCP